MLARSDQPGEVLLRRELRCDGGRVVGYFDDIKWRSLSERADEPADTSDGKSFDLQDFLLEDLQRARSGHMRDIVETTQREQFLLVSDDREGMLVVQGGPGTGKTAVGLHRISWLLFNDVFRTEDVLVVGPHKGFLDYVSEVLPQLGTHGVTSLELVRLWDGDVRGADPLEAQRVKSGASMAEVLRRLPLRRNWSGYGHAPRHGARGRAELGHRARRPAEECRGRRGLAASAAHGRRVPRPIRHHRLGTARRARRERCAEDRRRPSSRPLDRARNLADAEQRTQESARRTGP